jgi:hypothetical protein
MLRPLVLLNTIVACAITIIFGASVEAQAGAYATGVLAMMLSASVAVLLFAIQGRRRRTMVVSAVTALLLSYAFIANEIQQPDGLVITVFFIAGIMGASLTSRIARTTELRTERIVLDEAAQRFIRDADTDNNGQVMIVAHRPRPGDDGEAYAFKEQEQRRIHGLTSDEHVLFLEMAIEDASDFSDVLVVTGHEVGEHRILRGRCSTVPNAIAALLLHINDDYGVVPHCYFGWTEGSPVTYMLRYVLFGEGDTAPLTREVLRRAQPDPTRRPPIHVGG